MKRAAGLRGLSEDHHRCLVQAGRLRAAGFGEAGGPAEAAGAFLQFWGEVCAHFRKEEEVLVPVFARCGGNPARQPVVEMLAQHARIRGLVMQLGDEVAAGDARPETLRCISELLEAHIRLEERQVFPLVEEILADAELEEVASRLAGAGTSAGR